MRRLWLSVYRRALGVLPERLRREHGAEMLAHHEALMEDRWRSGRRFSAMALWAREVWDVLATAVRARRVGGAVRGFSRERGPLRSGQAMDRFRQDVRFAVRTWIRSPVHALISVMTLALAIGANTAIFTVVDAVLLKPLPYRSAGDLVLLHQKLARPGWDRGPVSYPNFADWRAAAHSFQDMAAYRSRIPRTLTGAGDAEQIAGAETTSNLFTLLGVGAVRGRTFTEGDEGSRVIVLGESLWRRRYGADPAVIGSSITLDDATYSVVGVMPDGFDFPTARDEYWMLLPDGGPRDDRDTNYLEVIARLAPGSTAAGAQAEMQSIFDRMRAVYTEEFGTNQPNVESVREVIAGESRQTLVLLTFAVGLLLLVACANLANLVLIRATGRAHELAMRAAMGAGRGRVVRQLVTENGLLAVVGAMVGTGIAIAGTRVLLALGPQSIPRRGAIDVDTRALLFTAVVAALTALLFGVLPALRITTNASDRALRDSGRSGASRGTGRLQRGLVVAQIGLAFVLLTSAALLVTSFVRLAGTATGMNPDNVLTGRLAPPGDRYDDPVRVRAFFDDVLGRVSSIAGVEHAGGSFALPFTPGLASGRMVPEGATIAAGEEPQIGLYPVRGDYFEALDIPLLAGRLPGPSDDAESPRVAAINQVAAERLWPGENPIGKRFCRCSVGEVGTQPWITVVGVVGAVKRFELGEPPPMESYWSWEQAGWAREMWLAIRTNGDPLAVVEPLRAAVRSVDANVPLTAVGTMTSRISTTVSEPRFRSFVVASFAGLGAILALIGIYGVMAFAVAQRTREIGVRMALGARRSSVLRGVLGEGGRLIATGLIFGSVGAVVASRFVAGLLFEITPFDRSTWLGVAILLVTGAGLACLVPASRASRVAPLIALRGDD